MELTQAQERLLRRAFRHFNRNMLLMWRLGFGKMFANAGSGYIMVLGTTGRKTGEHRLAPLNFAEHGDAVYCLAGFGPSTHWLLNLQADSQCEVWLPDGRRLGGSAEVVTDEAERVTLVREILIRSGFAAKVAHPGITLSTAQEEEIASLGLRPGLRYEVVKIKLGRPATGSGGPGDLAWLLPVSALVSAAIWLAARRFRAAGGGQ